MTVTYYDLESVFGYVPTAETQAWVYPPLHSFTSLLCFYCNFFLSPLSTFQGPDTKNLKKLAARCAPAPKPKIKEKVCMSVPLYALTRALCLCTWPWLLQRETIVLQ